MSTVAVTWPPMLAHPFMQNAFLAGTAVALAAGLVGYFLVLRAQVFTADALSHVAFTGALAALAAGVDARIGLFAITVMVAVAMGGLSPRARPDDVIVGGLFAWILGLGVFLLSIYTRTRSGSGNGAASVNVLFGSIFGISSERAWTTAIIAAIVTGVMLLLARPLLFASLDPEVAGAHGVPVRVLGFGFLAVVGVTAAEASQVVGALLILGLLAAPAGAAMRLTSRPLRAFALSAAIAVASMWIGLAVSFAVPKVPPSFAILATATLAYVCAGALSDLRKPVRGVAQPGVLAGSGELA
jgi:zinc/manganese transport system permease protein